MRDCLKRPPQSARWSSLQECADDRLEAVAIAIDRMPQRDESACLGKEQKENAIEDGQRLLEEHTGRKPSACPRGQGPHDCLKRMQHAVSECPAYLDTMTRRQC